MVRDQTNSQNLTKILNHEDLWHYQLRMKPRTLIPRIKTAVCHGYTLGIGQKVKLLHTPVVFILKTFKIIQIIKT